MRYFHPPHKITAALSEVTAVPAYFAVTSECVIACTDRAIRFCTPTLRINLATCAFTVRSFNAQRSANLLVGTARHQHFQHFLFAVGKGHAAGGKDSSRGRGYSLMNMDSTRAWRPYRSWFHNADRLGRIQPEWPLHPRSPWRPKRWP